MFVYIENFPNLVFLQQNVLWNNRIWTFFSGNRINKEFEIRRNLKCAPCFQVFLFSELFRKRFSGFKFLELFESKGFKSEVQLLNSLQFDACSFQCEVLG